MSDDSMRPGGGDLIFAVDIDGKMTVLVEARDVASASERGRNLSRSFYGPANLSHDVVARIASREEAEAFEVSKASWNGEVRLAAIFLDQS